MRSKTSIIGTVGRDAELTTTKNGQNVTKFSVAVKDGKDKTVWYNVSSWGTRAETDAQYVKKGMLIAVEGRLQTDENGLPRVFTDKSGNVRASNFELTAFETTYLSRVQADETATQAELDVEEEEIPF